MKKDFIVTKEESFLKSALSSEQSMMNENDIVEWLKGQNNKINVNIKKIPFSKLFLWEYDEANGTIRHQTGKFFSVDGIRVRTNWGSLHEWDQPVLNQPEIGFLGFITKEFNGILHFLVQAKIEPGNINYVQISPTLQATRSNFTMMHRGKKPLYLDYFQNVRTENTLLDQLQSEQGARFLKKRNRNIIIKIEDDIPVYDNFKWLTLSQLKSLTAHSNLVNMDTRTVISGITYGSLDRIGSGFPGLDPSNIKTSFLKSAMISQGALNDLDDIITFLTKMKSNYDLDLEKVPLKNLNDWSYSGNEISHRENKYFKVIAVEVEIDNREVINWSQPMIEPAQNGLCAFVCKEINGLIHFAVQAKLECGNFDIIEFAPTVQCLTGNYRDTKEGTLPFLDYILNVNKEKIFYDALQSEEGGRFYREQNRNLIVVAGDEVSVQLPQGYIWMTLNQLFVFLKFNNYLNIQARSLISAISFI